MLKSKIPGHKRYAVRSIMKILLGNVLCYSTYLRLIPKPSRKNGISVMIKTKDEEEWIGLNLQSLKDFADEIVVVDSSTDRTPEIIEEVASEYNLNLRLIRYKVDGWVKTKEHAELSNIALRNTSFRWVVRWEGDFIASDSIMKIREDILNSNPNIYHVISFPTVNLDGDIFHQNKGGELNIEARPHTYSDALTYKDIRQYEVLRVPLWYKPSYKYVLKGEYFIFHMGTVKNARRLLFRYFWLKWRKTNDYNRFPRIEDYVGYGIKKDWEIDNIEEAVKYYMNEILCKSLVPYDKERFGDYPELLKKELENPRYKVIYKDGKIIGRNDTLQGW